MRTKTPHLLSTCCMHWTVQVQQTSALRAARAAGLLPHPRGCSAEELSGQWEGMVGEGFRPEVTFHRVMRRHSAHLSSVRRKNLPVEDMEV